MAEAAEPNDTISSSSESADTPEDTVSLLCDPCDEDGQRKPAIGYCVDCTEYLCDICYSHHRTPRPFRSHVLQDSTKMPKTKDFKETRIKGSKVKCSIHPKEDIAFYCMSHYQICCLLCIPVTHGLCKDVKNIAEISSNLTGRDDFNEFAGRMKTLIERYTETKTRAQKNIELVNLNFSEAMDACKVQLEEIRANNISKMKAIIEACDPVLNQVKKWQTETDRLKDKDQLFVYMKMTGGHFDRLVENHSQLLRMETKTSFYQFIVQEPDSEKATVLCKIAKIPFRISQIALRHDIDEYECCVRDMRFIEQYLLLISDESNENVKLINTKENVVLSSLSLPATPHRIAFTCKKEAFVTLTDSTMVHLLDPSTDLNKHNIFKMNGKCKSIEYHNKKIRVQYFDPNKLAELDEDGKYVRTINSDISKAKTFARDSYISNPMYSCLNKESSAMIVSCWKNNSIAEIATDGTVKLIVQSKELSEPRGLEWLPDGSILVCATKAKKVLRVNQDGDIEDFLKEEITFEPITLRLDWENTLLYVAGRSDKAFVYQMKYLI